MSVSDVVQEILGQRPIDCAKQDVAVQRRPKAGGVLDSTIKSFHQKSLSSGTSLEVFRGKTHLELSDIVPPGVDEAVQVVLFHSISINQKDAPDSHAGKRLGNHYSHTADAHNPDLETLQVCLGLAAPSGQRATKATRTREGSGATRAARHAEATANNANFVAPMSSNTESLS